MTVVLDVISVVWAFLGGVGFASWLAKRRARQRFRCPTCNSETTPEGHGANAALGDDCENWGRR